MGSEGASTGISETSDAPARAQSVGVCARSSLTDPPPLSWIFGPFTHSLFPHTRAGRKEKSARKMSGREEDFFGGSGKKEEDPWIVVVNAFPSNWPFISCAYTYVRWIMTVVLRRKMWRGEQFLTVVSLQPKLFSINIFNCLGKGPWDSAGNINLQTDVSIVNCAWRFPFLFCANAIYFWSLPQ